MLGLSRSVKNVRTILRDRSIAELLTSLLRDRHEDVVEAASAALCNLLLEVSSVKPHVIANGALVALATLFDRSPAIRLNAGMHTHTPPPRSLHHIKKKKVF